MCCTVVDDYVYLGTMFNYNGLFNKAIKKQVSQARRAMYKLLSKAKKLALPIGSEVWGFGKLDQIQVFHRQFLKTVLRLNKRTANCMVYGEVGTFDLKLTVEKRMINFWIRLIQGSQSKIAATLYKFMKQSYDRDIVNENANYRPKWICKVKNILDTCGFSNMWNEHNVNAEWLVKSLELRLKDIEVQNWKSEVDRNNLCNIYRLFKAEAGIEPYLLKLDAVERINLCKFRCGNHKLPVSDSRYQHNPTNTKRCTLCHLNEQGDEFHYVLVCPILHDSRKNLLKKYYYTRPNVLKLNQLFNVENVKELSNLAKFVKMIMSLF
jgi:hypothetical protein